MSPTVSLGTMLSLQGRFFLVVIAGVFFRRKLVGAEFQKGFTTLMVDLVLPCNIIAAFQMELTPEVIERSLTILFISIGAQLVGFIVSLFAFRRCDPDRQCVMKFSTSCSNASFLGIPVAQGIWGLEGAFLASIYLVPQRIFMWSVGQMYFTSGKGKGFWKKILFNPSIDAVIIGLVLLVTQWQLPAVLNSAIGDISRCTTGLSMFLVGMLISHIRLREFLDKDVLMTTALRLVILPAILYICCLPLRAERMAVSAAVLLSAMPVGTICAVMASLYGRAERFAADAITVSTLLWLVTTPLWGTLLV